MDDEALGRLARAQEEDKYLISVATVSERKNTIVLAEAALAARVPVLFLGKPYASDDPYFLRFERLVDGNFVRYPGFVSEDEKYRYLRGARGFVLLSQFESGCIAVFEAAGAGLPLLLPNVPWATKSYEKARDISFVRSADPPGLIAALKIFYEKAHRTAGTTFPLQSWNQIAQRYLLVYEQLLGNKMERIIHAPGRI